MNNISFVVSSCDKYSTAWKPYFELVKKFWPEHPERIYLISESKQYVDSELNIQCENYPESYTWSERLYHTLEKIDTEYIIFSLEDFFLLGPVKQEVIDRCIGWMDENREIAECRLSAWCARDLGEYWEKELPDRMYRSASTLRLPYGAVRTLCRLSISKKILGSSKGGGLSA